MSAVCLHFSQLFVYIFLSFFVCNFSAICLFTFYSFISFLFTFIFSLHWNENTEPMIIKSLGRLALHNDTLLDLSGEHFNLTDFLPASALLSPKALSPLEEGDAAAAADPRQVGLMILF